MTRHTQLTLILAACAAAAAWGSAAARGDVALTNFTAGDLVVLRGGSATYAANTYYQVPVYLDEYTTAGVYVGTLPISATPGAQNELTLPSNLLDQQHEGTLSLSSNAQYLSFAGYNADPTTNFNYEGNVDPYLGKRIGYVGYSTSSLNTSTVVQSYGVDPATGALSANPFIRGAITNYGPTADPLTGSATFWTFGKYAVPANPGSAFGGGTSGGGIACVTGTGAGASTTTVEGWADWRDVTIVNGQMYGGCGSSSIGAHGAWQVCGPGTSSPTINIPTTNLGADQNSNLLLTSFPGGNSASNLSFVDIVTNNATAGTMNGENVLYTIGDQNASQIVKYYYNSTSQQWVSASGNLTLLADTYPTGLSAQVDPTNPSWVDLYVSGPTGVYKYVDKSGDPTAALPANAFTGAPLITPAAGTTFYGVAPAPSLAGDFNHDNRVDGWDLDQIGTLVKNGTGSANAWAAGNAYNSGLVYDLNADGVVNRADIDYLVHNVLHTNYGDADLDGKITIDDYLAIDTAYRFGLVAGKSRWAQGDFNGDGVVNALDYALIDASYLTQDPASAEAMIALHTAWFGAGYAGDLAAAEGVESVPEPASLGLLGAGGMLWLAGRRRRGGRTTA